MELGILHSIFLGIVQGLTEFLPISSSGHLVIIQQILDIEGANAAYDTILHMGTLVAVLFFFYNDIIELIKDFVKLIGEVFSFRFNKIFNRENPYRILLLMVIFGTIPTVIIGFTLKDTFEKLFVTIDVVGYTLIITGVMLWFSNRIVPGSKKANNIKLRDALTIGVFQGMAITPGISRSGSTVFAGLICGFNMDLAARFSFILSIPAILGAVVLQSGELINVGASFNWMSVIVGFTASAISGYVAIKTFINVIKKHKLQYFYYYCWVVGIAVVIYSIAV